MKKILTTIVTLITLFLCACTPNNVPNQTPTPHTSNVTPTPELVGCYTPTPTALQIDTTKFTSLYVTGSTVNVRGEANTNSNVITTLARNTLVKAYFEKDGWYYISINDKTFGYMSSKYLSENRVPETREEALGYTNLPKRNSEIYPDGSMNEALNQGEYDIVVAKEKILQITQKIKNKDSKIGAKVDALVAKWNEFVPGNTQYYYDLILEFEPGQGTVFYTGRIFQIYCEYQDLLDVLENIYLMMIGFEKYVDNDADDASASKEDYQKEYDKLEDSIIQINNKLVNEKNNNTQYAQQAEMILKWCQAEDPNIYTLHRLKWEILAELDFSKNSKSFEFYKTYDKYRIYKNHEYDFKDIDLIMRGESSFMKG